MTKDANLSFRASSALRAALEKLAAEDRRKLGSYINLVLEDHVAARRASETGAKNT